MTQLKVWTGVKKATVLEKVFNPALSGTGLSHLFTKEDEPPTCGPGELLYALGDENVKRLKALGVVPKNLGLGKLRERVFPYGEGHCMVSWSPNLMDMDPAREPEILWDARLAVRFLRTGKLDPIIGKYQYVEHFNQAFADIKLAIDGGLEAVPVSFDLETIGFDPFSEKTDTHPGAKIVSVAFTVNAGTAYVYRVPESGMPPQGVLDQIRTLVTSKKVKLIGANLKFDNVWLMVRWDIEIKNHKFDTFLVGSLLNENIGNSLNMHAKMHTDMGGYDDGFNNKYDKGRMDIVLAHNPDEFLTYAGGDTDAAMRVMAAQKPRLIKDRRLANFYLNLVQQVSNAFARVEARGVVVDIKRYDELRVEVTAKLKELEAKALAMIPRKIRIKYQDNLSLTRAVILRDYLFTPNGLNLEPMMLTEKEQLPSTSMDHLIYFQDNPEVEPFIAVMKEWGSAKKTLSTYIDGFMKHLRPDGRFHPTYYLGHSDDGGTDTGRSSCKDPAYQTIPKHTIWAKPLRTVYVPPPGYAILKCDFSQGESRITACVANEPTMLKTFRDGIDLHLKTGAALNGYDLQTAIKMMESKDPAVVKLIKEIRQGGKIGNFGLIYGMSAAGLVEYARTQYGVKMTYEAAEAFRNLFFETYPGLITWHETYKHLAHKHKYVRSPLGRVRHLPLIDSFKQDLRAQAERQAINSPIQGTLSDMCELTIAMLYQQYPDLWVFGFTHDSLEVYVPADDVEGWAKRIKDVMENLPLDKFGWLPQLSFPADAEYSLTNLAECQSFKKAA